MFNRRLDCAVEYYDLDDHGGWKLLGTLLLAFAVAFFTFKALGPFLVSEVTPYDNSLILLFFTGAGSIAISFFTLSYLVNVVLGSLDYLQGFSMPTSKEELLSFKMDTLFDVTLKNPIFYYFSLCLGHFAGIYERYTYAKTLGYFAPWETMPSYFFTYVKYPVVLFLYGIVVIALLYMVIVGLQKPMLRFLSTNDASYVSKMAHRFFRFAESVIFYGKKKSMLMAFMGLLPSGIFALYTLGFLPGTLSLTEWAGWYMKCLVVAYPFTALLFAVSEKVKKAKETKRKEAKTTIDGESVKAKQTSYDTVSPIFISDYVDKEVNEAIKEINAIVEEINPYLKLADIEEAHVLKRITEQEIVNLIKHYNKLPNDTKEELKSELLERLQNAKEVAKEISQISKDYHYDAFKKQSNMMDKRYNEKENA